MSDLIPKTSDVRDAYSAESIDSTYANRMFDLWLAKYKAKTITNEQERIIKLLEASASAWSEDCTLPIDWKHCQNCWQSASIIELIKGESNAGNN